MALDTVTEQSITAALSHVYRKEHICHMAQSNKLKHIATTSCVSNPCPTYEMLHHAWPPAPYRMAPPSFIRS